MRTHNNFLCFVHIEKAGGITLHNCLHWNRLGYISPSPKEKFGEHITATDLHALMRFWPGQLSGIGGHRVGSFLGYETVVEQPLFVFAFLRDPIKRFLSHYNWQRHIKGVDWTVESFLSDGYYDNFQCYRIAGIRDFEAAKTQIDKMFNFVGLMEHYDQSMLMLAKRLGCGFQPYYDHSNRKDYGGDSTKWVDLTEKQRDKVLLANQEDLLLYEYITETIYPRQMVESPLSDSELRDFIGRNAGFRLPRWAVAKRKLTNKVLAWGLQPLIQGR